MRPLITPFLLIVTKQSCLAELQYWYLTPEEVSTHEHGKVATLSCPLGHYRNFDKGYRMDGCVKCPPGRYGSSKDLTSAQCTGACPIGTYRDRPGAKSIKDCIPCPRGTYGDTEGLTTRQCSGLCSSLNTKQKHYYGDTEGMKSRGECKVCPDNYLMLGYGCKNFDQVMAKNGGEFWTGYIEKSRALQKRAPRHHTYLY